MSEGDIKILYKTLRTDSAENFNDIDWTFFNTDGERRMTIMPDARIGIGMDPWVNPDASAILELTSGDRL